jgi:hypothetical protein
VMARETKEQFIADRNRGRVVRYLDAAYLAMYQLGHRHGREDCLREVKEKTAKKPKGQES